MLSNYSGQHQVTMTAFFNTLILLGAVQGFIVCSLLFFSKKNRQTNRLLATLILLISLACFNLYGSSQDWFHLDLLRFLANLIPLVIVMPFGPLIYFYFQSSLDPHFKINKNERRHFFPVLVDLVPSLTIVIYVIGLLTKTVKNNPAPWGLFIDNFNVYADIPRWMSVSFYVWRSAKYLAAYQQKNNGILNGHGVYFKWLKQFTSIFMVFQSIWLIYLVPYIIPAYSNWVLDNLGWYPIYIPLAILIYWLGIKGYMVSQQQVLTDKKTSAFNHSLAPELIQQVVAGLTKAMEDDKVFLNPGLTVSGMAETTGFSSKIISAVLNQHLQKSFNEFVNGYRIRAFKEKILLPETNHLTIAGIAMECGFNSQATFQRTFKEFTGKSPSAFRKTAMVTD